MNIDLAIPSSFTSNLHSLMQRSFSISSLARAAACFGVRSIYIYPDPLSKDRQYQKELVKILRYLITPPYLKKTLFYRDPDLAYVGALPPVKLNLFKEKKSIKSLEFPEYRIGYTIGKKKKNVYILDVGLDKFVVIRGEKPPKVAIVKIVKNLEKYLSGYLVDDVEAERLNLYKGYKVIRYKESLITLLNKYKGLKIGLSRYGEYIGDIDLEKIKKDIFTKNNVLLVFGSHSYGLKEIMKYYDVGLDIFDYFINLVYGQKVETIRVEEAVWISLSLINYITNYKS